MLIKKDGIEEIFMIRPTTNISAIFRLIFRNADVPFNFNLLSHSLLRFLKSLLLPDHFPFAFNMPTERNK